MSYLLKDPQAILNYAIDWGAEYLDGDAIATSDWEVAPIESGGANIAGWEVRSAGRRPCSVRSVKRTDRRISWGGWDLGILRGERVEIDGQQVVGTRAGAISAPAGGSVIDAEARTTVSAILSALRLHGLIAS